MLYGIGLATGWWVWCWLDGQRDAYTFAITQTAEAQRFTLHWRYATVHWLLFWQRVVGAGCLFCGLGLAIGWIAAFKLILGVVWLGDRLRNGSMRIEQGRSFLEGGHRWFQTMPVNCPDWVLKIGWPVVSCRRIDRDRWLWEFLELNGKLSIMLAGLAAIGSIAWVMSG